MELRSAILSLLHNYVNCCECPLSITQIHQMLTVKCEYEQVESTLWELVQEKSIIHDKATDLYSVPGGIFFAERAKRQMTTSTKLNSIKTYMSFLEKCPWIYSVVLTGSCSLDNSTPDDDVDLMILTAPHTMFICRAYAIVLAQLMGTRRRRGSQPQPGTTCLNIILESPDLRVPDKKQGIYGAREIVSSKVLFQKVETYRRFIESNADWIVQALPNMKGIFVEKTRLTTNSDEKRVPRLVSILNLILGEIQLMYMKPHITNEIITRSQLWFHPKLRG